jgi:transcriptional regulator with XRE-family HTH domain
MNNRNATPLDLHMRRHGIKTAAIAALCGVTPTTVRYWRLGQRRPEPQLARLIAAELNMPRHLLRPDLWDPPPTVAAGADPAPQQPDPPRAGARRRATRNRAIAGTDEDQTEDGRLAFA